MPALAIAASISASVVVTRAAVTRPDFIAAFHIRQRANRSIERLPREPSSRRYVSRSRAPKGDVCSDNLTERSGISSMTTSPLPTQACTWDLRSRVVPRVHPQKQALAANRSHFSIIPTFGLCKHRQRAIPSPMDLGHPDRRRSLHHDELSRHQGAPTSKSAGLGRLQIRLARRFTVDRRAYIPALPGKRAGRLARRRRRRGWRGRRCVACGV